METNAYEEILSTFVKLYNQLEDAGKKKLILMQLADELEHIKWAGLLILLEHISEDILSKEESGMTLAILAGILSQNKISKSIELANKIDSKANVLFEWDFDAALAYGILSQAFLRANNKDLAKKYLDKSIEYALKIPDRSDRSIALARILPFIYELYGFNKALEFLQRITYEIKRVEAIVKLVKMAIAKGESIDVKVLLPLASKEKKAYILSELFLALANKTKGQTKELAEQILQLVQADTSIIDHLRALINALHIYLIGGTKIDQPEVSSLCKKIKSSIIQNLYKKEFLSTIPDLIDILLKFGYRKEVQAFLDDIKVNLQKTDSSSEVFIANRLSRIYAKYGDFDYTSALLSYCLDELSKVDPIIRTPLLIDSASSLLFVINEFPESIPTSLAEKYANELRPTEMIGIEVKIHKDNMAYLTEVYKEIGLDRAINEIIRDFRAINIKQLEESAKEILLNLLEKRDGSFVLNYILKYAYEANIPETIRLQILEYLGVAADALLKHDIARAREYTEFSLREFERRRVGLLPIIIRFIQEYVLAILP
ncbi:MAG: hypothetical protein QXH55_00720 [Candidatus Korarchaeota archaeon]|nr:hypothetical protein [Thermoproteota archaeon]MCR8462666.1 hypothetical protein [Thermoproteota archaeon]MCR8470285.1 hypothetical protein [Thermoproteota archaeon]MCR8472074.1 hypothetical protein [Thermoproteota archaeon]MCR8487942.1 hypothetical protein [Thermoproteota archaeon]